MIRFDHVDHWHGERHVLRDIDLCLTEQRVGIIGANGSGKSTLVRMINGLTVPMSGRVTVDGLDVDRQGAAVRRAVAFLFSDPDAQIVMPTVAEDLAFSLRRARLTAEQTTERITATLDRLGLADHHDHPCHLLSSGQKQLLALASVLVTEPDVLVCDEPTTLLDLRFTRQVTQLLADLPQRVVLVTHDLSLLTGWQRVLVVDDGRVVADGPAADTVPFYERLLA